MKFILSATISFFILFNGTCLSASVSNNKYFDILTNISQVVTADDQRLNNDKNDSPVNPTVPDDPFKKFREKFKDNEKYFDQRMNDDFFKSFNEQLKEMEQLRKKMEEQFNNMDGAFGNGLSGGDGLNLQTHEDDKYIYYDIHVGEMKPNDLNVNIKGSHVTISGKVSKKEFLDKNGGTGSQTYNSQFVRSFPVPDKVDVDKTDVRIEEQYIKIRFPKK